jgi:oligoendopeptidase F
VPLHGTSYSTKPSPGLTFTVDGEELNIEGTLDLLTEQPTGRETRGRDACALAEVFGNSTSRPSPASTTRLAKEKEIEDRWRGMPTPQTGRHLSNHVEPEVVEALRNAVVAAYPRLSHRYYSTQGQMARPRPHAGLGPQRAPAARDDPHHFLGRGRTHSDGRLCRL